METCRPPWASEWPCSPSLAGSSGGLPPLGGDSAGIPGRKAGPFLSRAEVQGTGPPSPGIPGPGLLSSGPQPSGAVPPTLHTHQTGFLGKQSHGVRHAPLHTTDTWANSGITLLSQSQSRIQGTEGGQCPRVHVCIMGPKSFKILLPLGQEGRRG